MRNKMRHKWSVEGVHGEGDDKVKTAECTVCGLQKQEKREGGIHYTEWIRNDYTRSSLDGHKTPACCP